MEHGGLVHAFALHAGVLFQAFQHAMDTALHGFDTALHGFDTALHGD
jgi:hypothetical protein